MNREIRIAIETGKVFFGSDRSVKAVKKARAKLAILASNCSSTVRTDIEHNAKLANIPIYSYPGDSEELGRVCRKPFLVAAIAIVDPGSSNILALGFTQ